MPLLHELPVYESTFIRLQPPNHLNAHGGSVLQQQVAAIAHKTDNLWLIDMAQVEFIDSAGLFALVSTLNLAHLSDCRLLLCHVRPSIKLVFEITQLDRVFEIVDGSYKLTDVDAPISDTRATALPERVAA